MYIHIWEDGIGEVLRYEVRTIYNAFFGGVSTFMKSAVAQVAYNFYILGLPYHLPDPVLHLQAKQPPASRASRSGFLELSIIQFAVWKVEHSWKMLFSHNIKMGFSIVGIAGHGHLRQHLRNRSRFQATVSADSITFSQIFHVCYWQTWSMIQISVNVTAPWRIYIYIYIL